MKISKFCKKGEVGIRNQVGKWTDTEKEGWERTQRRRDGRECAVPEKIHTTPREGNWKFLGEAGGAGGGRVLKVKILAAKYEAKLGRQGCKTKNLLWGDYGYFLEQHN